MAIDILVSEQNQQTVMNDFLGVRKGRIEIVLSPELTGNKRGQYTIRGIIPSENSIGYANYLRQMTSVSLGDFFLFFNSVLGRSKLHCIVCRL